MAVTSHAPWPAAPSGVPAPGWPRRTMADRRQRRFIGDVRRECVCPVPRQIEAPPPPRGTRVCRRLDVAARCKAGAPVIDGPLVHVQCPALARMRGGEDDKPGRASVSTNSASRPAAECSAVSSDTAATSNAAIRERRRVQARTARRRGSMQRHRDTGARGACRGAGCEAVDTEVDRRHSPAHGATAFHRRTRHRRWSPAPRSGAGPRQTVPVAAVVQRPESARVRVAGAGGALPQPAPADGVAPARNPAGSEAPNGGRSSSASRTKVTSARAAVAPAAARAPERRRDTGRRSPDAWKRRVVAYQPPRAADREPSSRAASGSRARSAGGTVRALAEAESL